MPEQFVALEVIEKKLDKSQFAVAYYTILKDALLNGDFVILNDEIPAYRIVRKNQPDWHSMLKLNG